MLVTRVKFFAESVDDGLHDGFHGTLTKNIPSIREHGLRASVSVTGRGTPEPVWMASSHSDAKKWAQGIHGKDKDISVVHVRHRQKTEGPVIRHSGSVHPSQIKAITHYSGDKLLHVESISEPTDAQKEAGNYKKRHLTLSGLGISVENEKGSERSGTGAGGKRWSVKMPAAYGYFKRTEGADGDHVDCYLGPHAKDDEVEKHDVHVVHQQDHKTKDFDEHKVMLGFPSKEAALKTYHAGFSDGKGPDRVQKVVSMPMYKFKDWVRSEKPANESEEPTYYHGTSTAHLDSIRKNGIVPNGSGKRSGVAGHYDGDRANAVYLSSDMGGANRYANYAHGMRDKPAVLHVKVPSHVELHDDQATYPGNKFHIGTIHPSWITHVSIDGTSRHISHPDAWKPANEAAFEEQLNGKIHDKHGTEYHVRRDTKDGRHEYWVSHPGAPRGVNVGGAHLSHGNKRVMSVHVYPEHQRKGIASALYNHIEKDLGHKLEKNWATTPDGEALWKSRTKANEDHDDAGYVSAVKWRGKIHHGHGDDHREVVMDLLHKHGIHDEDKQNHEIDNHMKFGFYHPHRDDWYD